MTRLIALGKSTVPSWTQYIYSKHLLYQALPCTTHKHDHPESYPCQAHSPCSRVNIERGECLIHSADHYIIIGSISGYLLYAAGESVTADIPARVPDVLYGALRSESTQSIGGIKARSVPGRWCRETPEVDIRKGLDLLSRKDGLDVLVGGVEGDGLALGSALRGFSGRGCHMDEVVVAKSGEE